ncbi:unnamed protein product [Polarella glacialis]|uniref:EF-hand domain-containing protein n=1 Tax=Polarella glacialis TaxID=89957 RepID=A0A813FMI8_POLGL|nr:unnamed protein product [Polarella glacialis]
MAHLEWRRCRAGLLAQIIVTVACLPCSGQDAGDQDTGRFAACDLDRSGSLDPTEFAACVSPSPPTQDQQAAEDAPAGEDRASQEAAAYWRGGRVRASEEPNLPAPIIDNGTVDYQGYDQVEECLEYYVDKMKEEPLRKYFLGKELKAAEALESHAKEAAQLPRGLVAYLLMENADRTQHRDLLLSLRCLGRHFSGYPVAIFHTNGTTLAELAWMRSASPPGLQLIFEEVSLGFPASMTDVRGGPDGYLAPPYCTMDDQHWWTTHRSCGCRCPAWRPQCWPVNWMHATRFFTAGMFRTRTFREGRFDFFMRLDTDLFIVAEPVVDPFRLMAERGCAMVYDRISREAPGCFDGFDKRTLEFVDRFSYHGEPDDEILQVGTGPAAAGGQWTVGDARLFTSREYLRFADFFASGIYTDRWADPTCLQAWVWRLFSLRLLL